MKGLYDDQLRAASRFELWLTNSSETFAGLWASAGYGKSYTAKHLIDEVIIKNSNYIPIMCSMTNSAADVLADFVGRPVTTLHALMGWVPQVDKEPAEEYLSTPQLRDSNENSSFKTNTLVLID